jgi:hypothetical protein
VRRDSALEPREHIGDPLSRPHFSAAALDADDRVLDALGHGIIKGRLDALGIDVFAELADQGNLDVGAGRNNRRDVGRRGRFLGGSRRRRRRGRVGLLLGLGVPKKSSGSGSLEMDAICALASVILRRILLTIVSITTS